MTKKINHEDVSAPFHPIVAIGLTFGVFVVFWCMVIWGVSAIIGWLA